MVKANDNIANITADIIIHLRYLLDIIYDEKIAEIKHKMTNSND